MRFNIHGCKQYLLYPALMALLAFCPVGYADTTIGGMLYKQHKLDVGNGESSMSIADFDQDGHLDIAIANLADNNVIIFKGDGKGNLTKSSQLPAGEKPTDITAADINQDGFTDLLIANHETTYLTLLLGDGFGKFQTASNSPLSINVNPHPHVARFLDLDNDGTLDVLVDNRNHNGLLFLRGAAGGHFVNQGIVIELGGDPYLGFASGDIDGDGRLDLATPNPDSVGILLNDRSGDSQFSNTFTLPVASPFAVALVDITGDKLLDIVAASVSGEITIIPGNGKGAFQPESKSSLLLDVGAKQMATGDINGDGVDDVVISNWNSGVTVIFRSDDGFETARFNADGVPNPWGLALADLNEDGIIDILVADGNGPTVAVFISQ